VTLWQRLNHLNHLVEQREMKRYVVLYTAAGARPVACTIDTHALDRPFVARDKTYWTSTNSEQEAAYLCCFLNSAMASDRIRDWMTKGLFGPRDIHKRVLDLPWPEFIVTDPDHAKLSAIGRQLQDQARAADISSHLRVSERRQAVREALNYELVARAEELVGTIATSVAPFFKT
jgi:uncharacterized membrane-anchored protein